MGKEELDDDFFGELGFEKPTPEEKAPEASETPENGSEEPSEGEPESQVVSDDAAPDGLPKLVGKDYPAEYVAVVNRFVDLYQDLPKLDYEPLYKELAQLSTDGGPTPTLHSINLKLQQVQGLKDRLAEIYLNVIRNYLFKKRSVNVLTDAWTKFADGTSQDKRKADAAFRLSEFHADLAQVDAMHGICGHILKNLDDNAQQLSRQITIIQNQLKMQDVGRSALPDFDFNKSALGFDNEIGTPVESTDDDVDNVAIDETESRSAEELSF